MDQKMKEMYQSMTPAERQKFMQKQKKELQETGNKIGEEVRKKGIIGSALDIVFGLLFHSIIK